MVTISSPPAPYPIQPPLTPIHLPLTTIHLPLTPILAYQNVFVPQITSEFLVKILQNLGLKALTHWIQLETWTSFQSTVLQGNIGHIQIHLQQNVNWNYNHLGRFKREYMPCTVLTSWAGYTQEYPSIEFMRILMFLLFLFVETGNLASRTRYCLKNNAIQVKLVLYALQVTACTYWHAYPNL